MGKKSLVGDRLPKVIVILGPTASGKTRWSLRAAKKFNGEIISADSRQIYKKMDIGTAKEKGEWRGEGIRRAYYIEDIPHHSIDFLDPGESFSVAEFRDRAIKNIKHIHSQGRIPFLIGGTGLYIQSVVDNFSIPHIGANKKLRQGFEEKTVEELVGLLEKIDPDAAIVIDRKNKRRLIRALEVCILTGEPFSKQRMKGEPLFDVLQIGVEVDRPLLYRRIARRVNAMMKQGLLEEVRLLTKQKYGWHLPSLHGVGYREFVPYFEERATLPQVVEAIKKNTRQYAKRQMSWFRRDDRIQWCHDYKEAERRMKQFLQA